MARLITSRRGLRDIVVEAVNAKDPDLLFLADDLHISPELIEAFLELVERWPRLILSRGEVGGEPAAAIWIPDREGIYGLGGHLEFSVADATARIELVPGVHPRLVTEAPPGLVVAEWAEADAMGQSWIA